MMVTQPVDPWRFHRLIAITSQITVADVIEKHDYDVRFLDSASRVAEMGRDKTHKACTYCTF